MFRGEGGDGLRVIGLNQNETASSGRRAVAWSIGERVKAKRWRKQDRARVAAGNYETRFEARRLVGRAFAPAPPYVLAEIAGPP